MGKGTKIEWADHTFNPWWGCTKVSPGCQHCYAESFAKRTGHQIWGDGAERRFFGDAHWAEPFEWNERARDNGRAERVFCASMADVFEDRPDLVEPRARLFRMIQRTKSLIWLLLTKRPENILKLTRNFGYLPKNVWPGTSAENQEYWDKRVPELMSVPAGIHFVSMEPMLGPIDMGAGKLPEWIITGGESGPRQIQRVWAESIQKQCEGRTKFFFKQWGGNTPAKKHAAGRLLNGREYNEIPQAA